MARRSREAEATTLARKAAARSALVAVVDATRRLDDGLDPNEHAVARTVGAEPRADGLFLFPMQPSNLPALPNGAMLLIRPAYRVRTSAAVNIDCNVAVVVRIGALVGVLRGRLALLWGQSAVTRQELKRRIERDAGSGAVQSDTDIPYAVAAERVSPLGTEEWVERITGKVDPWLSNADLLVRLFDALPGGPRLQTMLGSKWQEFTGRDADPRLFRPWFYDLPSSPHVNEASTIQQDRARAALTIAIYAAALGGGVSDAAVLAAPQFGVEPAQASAIYTQIVTTLATGA